MTNEIVSKPDGYEVAIVDKTIFFPTAELKNVGCRNCIWKLNQQCPHELKAEEEKKEGICDEMLHFLGDLAEKDDSLTAIWEKFHIYKARLQESEDYKDFRQLKAEIEELEKTADSDEDWEKIREKKMDKSAAKFWWVKLNQHVVQSMQKVIDRDAKASGAARLPGIHSVDTINFINQEPKQLEKKDGQGDKEIHKGN